MSAPVTLAILLVVAVLITGVTVVRHARPAGRLAAAHAHARRVDLRLDPELEYLVAARLSRRERAGTLTALAAILLVAAGWWANGAAESSFLVAWLVVGYFLGHALGVAAVGWWESSRPVPPDAPRIARTADVTLDDYVAPIERRGLWAAAAVGVGVAVLPLLLRGAGPFDLGPTPPGVILAAAGVPLLAVGLVELACRAILGRRQVAATPLALAWDDAVRALALRDVVTVGLIVALLSPFALLGHVSDTLEGGWPANPAVGLVMGLAGVLLMVAVVTALIATLQQPQRWFRRRLWPDPAEVGR